MIQDIVTKYNSEKGDADKLAAFFATFLPDRLQFLAKYSAKHGGGVWFCCDKVLHAPSGPSLCTCFLSLVFFLSFVAIKDPQLTSPLAPSRTK